MSPRAFARGVAAACALGALSSVARPARAQDAQATASRALLLEQALEARGAGDHTYALELAERAARITYTPSVGLFLAQEQFAVGRYAAARASARRCAVEAGAPNVPNGPALRQECERLSVSLASRVALLRVVPAGASADATLTLELEGAAPQPLPAAGLALDLEPGVVRVRVRAPGFEPFEQAVTLLGGEARTLEVALAPRAEGSLEPLAREPGGPREPPPSAPASSAALRLRGPVVVLASGGALGLGALAAALAREGALDALAAGCDTANAAVWRCDDAPAQRDAWGTVQWTHGLALGLGVTSGLALAAGGVWLGLALAQRDRAPSAPRVTVLPTAGGVRVDGAF